MQVLPSDSAQHPLGEKLLFQGELEAREKGQDNFTNTCRPKKSILSSALVPPLSTVIVTMKARQLKV